MSRTQPDKATRQEEQLEVHRAHEADRPATRDEARKANQAKAHESEAEARAVAEHAQEMSRLGADDQGEGRID